MQNQDEKKAKKKVYRVEFYFYRNYFLKNLNLILGSINWRKNLFRTNDTAYQPLLDAGKGFNINLKDPTNHIQSFILYDY